MCCVLKEQETTIRRVQSYNTGLKWDFSRARRGERFEKVSGGLTGRAKYVEWSSEGRGGE